MKTRVRAVETNRTKQVLLGLVLAVAVMVPNWTLAAAPAVDNAAGAANVMSISAVLNGTLTSTGGLPSRVYAYWGATDGGTTFGSWAHANDLGTTNAVGLLSLPLTGLVPNQTYYYRFYATNVDGQAWASATTSFLTRTTSGPAPVNLGSTARFTILAGAAITSTGGGTIDGDVGASPIAGSAIGLNAAQVNGIIYAVDFSGPAGSVRAPALLTTAKGDLTIAYNDARDRAPVPDGPFLNPGSGNVGGLTLVPGLYKFTGTAYITGSDVTLAGGPDDVWIFQVGSDLQVGSTVQVILAGGAQARNVFWQVGTSATIGTFAVFKGTIMAAQAITMDTSSTIDGRALAFTAGVTFNGTAIRLPSATAPRYVQKDFDGDGISDFSVVRQSKYNNTWYVYQSSLGALAPFQFGAVGDKPIPADYDGDGLCDVAVLRPSTMTWYIYGSSDGAMATFVYGARGDIPMPVDFDGDGTADVAVMRPSTMTWYICGSSDGVMTPFVFGARGDIPVPADYDSDGMADVAVMRPSTMTWYISGSRGGPRAPFVFGAYGDIPVPGDYDGDGFADVAVFRPSNAKWYILSTKSGLSAPIAYGAPGDLPLK